MATVYDCGELTGMLTSKVAALVSAIRAGEDTELELKETDDLRRAARRAMTVKPHPPPAATPACAGGGLRRRSTAPLMEAAQQD